MKISRLPWPVNESGEKVKAVFLCTRLSVDMSDEITRNLLETYGIPNICTYPGDGSFGKVVLGMSGEGVNILVPESRLEEAKDLIDSSPVEDEESEPSC